jgi:hypothetical protein
MTERRRTHDELALLERLRLRTAAVARKTLATSYSLTEPGPPGRTTERSTSRTLDISSSHRSQVGPGRRETCKARPGSGRISDDLRRA